MIQKIISGGQTGADRVGLDVAIAFNLEYGGYIPRGRRTERDPLALRYDNMIETDSRDYPPRTLLNIIHSDGTVVFTFGHPTGGSALTLRKCLENFKPSLHINLKSLNDLALTETDNGKSRDAVCRWLDKHCICILNVAGSRKSKFPKIYERVFSILEMVIYRQLNDNGVYDSERKREASYMNPFIQV